MTFLAAPATPVKIIKSNLLDFSVWLINLVVALEELTFPHPLHANEI